jgi:anti-anti-sigma regulatory factor
MRVTCERAQEGVVVRVAGRLTASESGRLREHLLAAFDGARRVEVVLQDVGEADLTFLQLLCAAHRTAAARGVALLVSGLASAEPVARLIREAGAERGAGCPEGCLWPAATPAPGSPRPQI